MCKTQAASRVQRWRMEQTPRVTQRQLADRLHVDPSYISSLERGDAKPSSDLQYEIEQVTGVPMQLWHVREEMPRAARRAV